MTAREVEELRASVAALTHLLETHEGVVADYSDRLRLERDRLQAVFRDIPAAVAVLRGPSLRFEFVNDRFVELIGGRSVVGMPVREAFPEIEGQGYFELLESVLATGTLHEAQESRVMLDRGGPEPEEVFSNYTYVPLPAPDGTPEGILIHAVDVTELVKSRERERREAEILQRSLLPGGLPFVPELDIAVRYLPGGDARVGGDWYDVFRLPDGRVACALGDVVGHGTRAASVMAQIRTAVRAYAFEGHDPVGVLAHTDRLLQSLDAEDMATLVYAVFDAEASSLTIASAGHPPPLIRRASTGEAEIVPITPAPPLGIQLGAFDERTIEIGEDDVVVLYSDGLVERRRESLDVGLERLRGVLSRSAAQDATSLCDDALAKVLSDDAEDDVALLVIRRLATSGREFKLRIDAEPGSLGEIRDRLRGWLTGVNAPADIAEDVLIAVGEAAANAVEHAYRMGGGPIELETVRDERGFSILVRDFGGWQPPRRRNRGLGLRLMRAFMDEVIVRPTPEGTEILLRRMIRNGGSAA